MPRCGSQVILCDVPIRFDTYQGCSHDCAYCFARKGVILNNIKPDESVKSLKSFITGERTIETKWCDWAIPLHWGGLSDPLQPCEKKYRRTYECLQLLKETQYPFIISTKGKLAGDPEYVKLLSECNCVVQISLVDPLYDKYELGCPSFQERVEIIQKLTEAGVKRLNVRCQPYIPQIQSSLIKHIPLYKSIGVHGLILEGLKNQKKTTGMIKVAGDYAYPLSVLEPRFKQVKAVCHDNGLVFYSGENRLRKLGDSLCCCGIENLEGFKENTYNLNHYYNDPNGICGLTEKMSEPKTAQCFKALNQTSQYCNEIRNQSFKNEMLNYKKQGANIFSRK